MYFRYVKDNENKYTVWFTSCDRQNPFAILDFEKDEFYIDHKMKNGSSGSDGFWDEKIVKAYEKITGKRHISQDAPNCEIKA